MRFIRDIIEEKKSATLPEASPEFGSGLDEGMAQDGEAILSPDPLYQAAEPPMDNVAPTPSPSDEQSLRSIFKTEIAQEPSAEPHGGRSDLQHEMPELDHAHDSADATPNHPEPAHEPLGDPMQRGPEPRDVPTAMPNGSDVPADTDMGPQSQPATLEEPLEPAKPVEVPQPAAGRMLGRSGRVKTRVLGFGQPEHAKTNVFNSAQSQSTSIEPTFPVGWLVLVKGPGKGAAFTLYSGVSSIGRNPDQSIALAFGDTSISRENHAAIAYDAEQRSFFLGHGGKTNLVRLNDRPVLSTEELKSDDVIRIGETTLRFVALCGEKFSWPTDHANGVAHDAAQ